MLLHSPQQLVTNPDLLLHGPQQQCGVEVTKVVGPWDKGKTGQTRTRREGTTTVPARSTAYKSCLCPFLTPLLGPAYSETASNNNSWQLLGDAIPHVKHVLVKP